MWQLQSCTSPMSECSNAFIGLGGNVGDVLASMKAVLGKLDAHEQVRVIKVSPVYKTPPWGVENQDWFLNACAELSTPLSPHELLDLCLETEKALKRERKVRWGPRTIDLDILLYGDTAVQRDKLEIPHPRMHERLFVMQPLSDIAPDVIIKGQSAKDWVAAINEKPLGALELAVDWWV